jgi:Fur family ferric uptake transcriptional regulator
MSRIEQLCAEKGLRMTGQRRVVAKVLAESQDHPDVEELHRRASALDPNISVATVYRTVRLFEEANILSRHDFGDGRARYEENPAEHHDHLIDVHSREVIEFRSDEIEELQREVARRLGYRLVGHRLELYGVPLEGPDPAEVGAPRGEPHERHDHAQHRELPSSTSQGAPLEPGDPPHGGGLRPHLVPG